jgi:hypothetical protein
MDIDKILGELRKEREHIDVAIVGLCETEVKTGSYSPAAWWGARLPPQQVASTPSLSGTARSWRNP